jgi:transposase
MPARRPAPHVSHIAHWEGQVIFGVDSHKASLSVCAIDPLGRKTAEAEFPNSPAGHRRLLAWARAQSPSERRFGIEGSGSYAYVLARALLASDELVVEVPPAFADRERRRRRRGKSDALDALAIARVAAREELSPLRDDPAARDLKLACDYRAQLKAERTRTANRLHADLVQLAPGYQARCPNLSGRPNLAMVARILGPHRGLQGELARRRLAALRRLDAEIAGLERRIRALVKESETTLTELPGVGVLGAARIIGEVRDVRRFANRDRFARANGTAPLPASSGTTVRHRLNRGGNRRLNWALHLMALTQARSDPRARAYLERRRAEGLTHREAVRALKRHLSDVVYRQLQADARRLQSAAALT